MLVGHGGNNEKGTGYIMDIIFTCRANRISCELHVNCTEKEDQLREQGGTEERRAGMIKGMMAVLCHSKNCATNKRCRGLVTS